MTAARTSWRLSRDQRRGLQQVRDWLVRRERQYFILGGYAGTGKTTLIAALRRSLLRDKDWRKKSVGHCCFTGKAANVLRHKLAARSVLRARDTCSTIHRLIYRPITDMAGQVVEWEKISPTEFTHDLIVVDEASMVNEPIWHDLISFQRPILVVGDHGQLPPIDGNFSLMEKPDLVLETIVRQAAGNPIIQLAHRVRNGQNIARGKYGEHVLKISRLTEKLKRYLYPKLSDDYLVLCGYNRTRQLLNRSIRDRLGFRESAPQTGERVICLRNNHRLNMYNGVLGTIERIEPSGRHWYNATIEVDGEEIAYAGRISRHQFGRAQTIRTDREMKQLSDGEADIRTMGDLFDWGYALTVHKSQGSEAANVVLFEERLPRISDELWRRWLYTGITRATSKLLIVEQAPAG